MKYIFDSTIGDINILIRALRRYNKKGLIYLIFTVFPLLREGNFDAEEVKDNRIYIPFDRIFEFVYGKLYIEYEIAEENKIEFILNDKTKYIMFSLYRHDADIKEGIPIIDDMALFKYKAYKSIINNKEESI